MASELRVNTLKDSSGNNSVGMAYVAGGSAKAWVNINGSSGTPTAVDSLNISSITDNSTGRYGPVLTSPMGNTNFCPGGNSNFHAGDSFNLPSGMGIACSNVITTTTSTFEVSNHYTSYIDSKYCFVRVHGDLA
tara:strand:+ start:1072 stop:1473 length:402 start_codon:yes stop_codon:yes gene_type:complete